MIRGIKEKGLYFKSYIISEVIYLGDFIYVVKVEEMFWSRSINFDI